MFDSTTLLKKVQGRQTYSTQTLNPLI